eukprot:230276-Rhodomonas_salina.2
MSGTGIAEQDIAVPEPESFAAPGHHTLCQYRTLHSSIRNVSTHTLAQYLTLHSTLEKPYAMSVPDIA